MKQSVYLSTCFCLSPTCTCIYITCVHCGPPQPRPSMYSQFQISSTSCQFQLYSWWLFYRINAMRLKRSRRPTYGIAPPRSVAQLMTKSRHLAAYGQQLLDRGPQPVLVPPNKSAAFTQPQRTVQRHFSIHPEWGMRWRAKTMECLLNDSISTLYLSMDWKYSTSSCLAGQTYLCVIANISWE